MDKDFYSVKEFAEKFCVSTHTIRRAIKSGRISVFRIGSSEKSMIRIPHSEIHRMAIIELQSVLKKMIREERNV